jgi:peptide/nickel transport system permease protein
MWPYVLRKLLYNIPVYLGIILIVMLALRAHDPVWAFIGKTHSGAEAQERYQTLSKDFGLDEPLLPVWVNRARLMDDDPPEALRARPYIEFHNPLKTQYVRFLRRILRLDFSGRSWDKPTQTVGERLREAIVPTLSITIPELCLTTVIAVCIGIVASYFRGGLVDRTLVLMAVLGMSISYLVYVVFGQFWGGYLLHQKGGLNWFAISGYEPGIRHWAHYCLLPVIIGVTIAVGFDTRYYRAVMVEETQRDYIATAKAKGASKPKVMFVHMLKNAMIPIITRVMITVPFLIEGSIVLERYFNIPGMGYVLIDAINAKDLPVIQTFAAVFALIFIVTNILTDVLYALVDPRVRLS